MYAMFFRQPRTVYLMIVSCGSLHFNFFKKPEQRFLTAHFVKTKQVTVKYSIKRVQEKYTKKKKESRREREDATQNQKQNDRFASVDNARLSGRANETARAAQRERARTSERESGDGESVVICLTFIKSNSNNKGIQTKTKT